MHYLDTNLNYTALGNETTSTSAIMMALCPDIRLKNFRHSQLISRDLRDVSLDGAGGPKCTLSLWSEFSGFQ